MTKIAFDYSLNKSFEELCIAIRASSKNKKIVDLQNEAHFRLGTCVHWLINIWERIEKDTSIKIDDKHKPLFSAFRYANNKLKHNETLMTLQSLSGGISFPISFPLKIRTITYRWVKMESDEKGHENQLKNYQKRLQDVEVINSILKAKEIAINYFNTYENKPQT